MAGSGSGPSQDDFLAGRRRSLLSPLPATAWSFGAADTNVTGDIPVGAGSIFGQTHASSPSRFTAPPSQAQPAVLTVASSSSSASAQRDERPQPHGSRTPSPPLPALDPLSSSPEDWRDNSIDQVRITADRRRRLPRVEKDVDDPTVGDASTRISHTRQSSTPMTTLSRLFAVQSSTSPTDSRSQSYMTQAIKARKASIAAEAASLPDHLYTRGLLSGRHSDLTVHAFGYPYKLHRLILDRAPFFASALSGPWLESNAKEITLHPDDIDSNITQTAFELALKRLYGAGSQEEEDADAVGLFATGCWLEMPDLVESSIDAMLRQMNPEKLSPLIRLVTTNYYGRAGDKILASAKAMLCRDGWKMPLKFWDGIPGDIIREIVGGDGFFVDGEWDRWVLTKRLLDRRLRKLAIEAGLTDSRSPGWPIKAPDAINLMAVRFDTVYRKNSVNPGMPDSFHRWITLYTHHDVEPLLVLLDEGIHYVHLPFEQLQYIRRARDVLGLPVMPERVISNALWMQMELRQKVLSAADTDLELGLAHIAEEQPDIVGDTSVPTTDAASSGKGKGKARDVPGDAHDEEEIPSDSWDGNGKPRKFWIPSADINIVMGGTAEPVVGSLNNSGAPYNQTSRLSASLQPEDVQWASDFAAITSDARPFSLAGGRPGSAAGSNSSDIRPVAYSYFPPFRFAAQFPNPRLLKEKKRVYSQTVFYLGSFWNVYVQRVRRGKNPQLGVYLHRAKEREADDVLAGAAGLAQASVDERIGHLEREMLLRSDRRAAERRRLFTRRRSGDADVDADAGDSSGSADPDLGAADMTSEQASRAGVRGLLGNIPIHRKSSQTDILPDSVSGSRFQDKTTNAAGDDSDDDLEDPEVIRLSKPTFFTTIPPYVDSRPTIKTFFKIFSPSKGGRMLSVYESAPDSFNFSQSWGWKSSTLALDDGLEEITDETDAPTGESTRKEGRLRFVIVIGNV